MLAVAITLSDAILHDACDAQNQAHLKPQSVQRLWRRGRDGAAVAEMLPSSVLKQGLVQRVQEVVVRVMALRGGGKIQR